MTLAHVCPSIGLRVRGTMTGREGLISCDHFSNMNEEKTLNGPQYMLWRKSTGRFQG